MLRPTQQFDKFDDTTMAQAYERATNEVRDNMHAEERSVKVLALIAVCDEVDCTDVDASVYTEALLRTDTQKVSVLISIPSTPGEIIAKRVALGAQCVAPCIMVHRSDGMPAMYLAAIIDDVILQHGEWSGWALLLVSGAKVPVLESKCVVLALLSACKCDDFPVPATRAVDPTPVSREPQGNCVCGARVWTEQGSYWWRCCKCGLILDTTRVDKARQKESDAMTLSEKIDEALGRLPVDAGLVTVTDTTLRQWAYLAKQLEDGHAPGSSMDQLCAFMEQETGGLERLQDRLRVVHRCLQYVYCNDGTGSQYPPITPPCQPTAIALQSHDFERAAELIVRDEYDIQWGCHASMEALVAVTAELLDKLWARSAEQINARTQQRINDIEAELAVLKATTQVPDGAKPPEDDG